MRPFALTFLLLFAVIGVNGSRKQEGRLTYHPAAASPGFEDSGGNRAFLGGGEPSPHDAKGAPGCRGSTDRDVPPDFFCHSCRKISRAVEELLSDPSVYAEADDLSSEVCRIVHSDLRVECRELVELYLHEGILILQTIFRGRSLCNATGFCPGESSAFSVSGHHEDGSSSGSTGSSILRAELKRRSCNACHTALDQILKDLEDHDQQVLMVERLMNACESFRRYADRCKLLVIEYGPIFLSYVRKFLMTRDVCRLVRMCVGDNDRRKIRGSS